jgi:hypothetical protein
MRSILHVLAFLPLALSRPQAKGFGPPGLPGLPGSSKGAGGFPTFPKGTPSTAPKATNQPTSAPYLPAKGTDGFMGGLFGMSGSSIGGSVGGANPLGIFLQGPQGGGWATDNSGGSGAYNASYVTDPSLPNHVIYAPRTPPKDVTLPVIVWGNSGCIAYGTFFSNFLTEIASHGYIVLANGPESLVGTLGNLIFEQTAGLTNAYGCIYSCSIEDVLLMFSLGTVSTG